MKPAVLGFVAAVALTLVLFPAIGLAQAQQPDNSDAPLIPFVSVPNYLKGDLTWSTQQLSQFLRWFHPAQRLSRPVVEHVRDPV